MKKLSKSGAEKQIQEFFHDIKKKNSKDIKKIKKLAMRNKIPLCELRKKFCKKCLMPYKNVKIRIKNKIKLIICEECGCISRYRIKVNLII